jgi:hypothetical protein
VSFFATLLYTYIIGVPLVGMCSRLLAEFAGWNQLGTGGYGAGLIRSEEAHRYSVLGFGYVLCLVALVLILPVLSKGRARRIALAIWALGLVFLITFIYPMTQVPVAR